MRDVFVAMLQASHRNQVPVVLHNGLLDLMFMYHFFYGPLPAKLPTFIADLSDMFPGGLYDTKYLSDYVSRESTSYLSYLFRKYERIHEKDGQLGCVVAEPWREPSLAVNHPLPGPTSLCEQYSRHGYCPLGSFCLFSHDLEWILDREEQNSSQPNRSKRKRDERIDEVVRTSRTESPMGVEQKDIPHGKPAIHGNQEKSFDDALSHTAYFDAYMTGYVFLHQTLDSWRRTGNFAELEEIRNRLYIIGKPIPLLVEKSAFTKCSDVHMVKRKKWATE